MRTLDNGYPVEIVERCRKWVDQDEGKIFWRWLASEIERLSETEEGFYGKWEMSDIVQANKVRASKEMSQFIADFPKMLDILIPAKKKAGKDLIYIDEIT